MAFDATEDLEQEGSQNQNGPSGQAGAQLSGGGGGFAGGSTSPGTTQAGGPEKPSTSGSWTNLNSYLSANQDQSSKLGSDIAGGIDSQAKQTQNDLSNVVQGFQNQAPYQTVNNTTSDDVSHALDASQYANGGDPSKALTYLNGGWGFDQNASNIQNYQGTSGPSWQNVSNEANQTAQNLQATQNEAGRQTLLSNQYAGKGQNYNQGEQLFDQLLLQQNPNNQQTLNGVYQQYSPQFVSSGTNSPALLQNAVTNAQSYDQAARAKAQQFQDQANSSLTGQISGLGANLKNEIATNQSQWGDQYNQLKNDLSRGRLNPYEAAQIGIPGAMDIYTVDPTSFLSQTANPYAGQQAANYAATDGDWSKFQGLQKLIGGMNNNSSAQSALSQTGLSGDHRLTAPDPYAFDSGGFKSSVNAAKSGYDAGWTAPNNVNGDMSLEQIDKYLNDINSWAMPDGAIGKDAAGEKAVADYKKSHGYGKTLAVSGTDAPVKPKLLGGR